MALLWGCVEDAGEATQDHDAAGAPDVGRADGAVPAPDSGGGGGDPDAGVSAGCAQACATLVECSIERCAGYDAAAREELGAVCEAMCAANPAFATVVNGAETCETVVAFVVDQGDEDYAERCRGGGPELPDIPDGSQCPWPCGDDEVCIQSRCVRADDTCETTYHCRVDEACREGRCRPAQFHRCVADLECDVGMRCVSFSQDPAEPGFCFIDCEGDADCPQSETCQAPLGDLCYFNQCGPGFGGEVYGGCETSSFRGTCYPSAEGNAQGGETTGFCIEGGTAEEDAACDAQAVGREAADLALRCAGGLFCLGDPDNPLNPDDPGDRQGACAALCDPRAPVCGEGKVCVDYTAPDDPATAFDETVYQGACFASDCSVFGGEGQCAVEETECRLLGVLNDAGSCGPAGDVRPGEPCASSDECAGVAICGNNGQIPMACIRMCEAGAEEPDCAEDELCFAQPGWLVGFCIPNAPGG